MPREGPPQEFIHSPLPAKSAIRLIRIHPNLHDKRLACTLEHFDPDSNPSPEYVAVSYVWGDPTPRHPIYINGLLRVIHTNLWLFLRRAWMNGAVSWFWTDSLSLDQNSHAELNVQVARMGDIYAGACHVISWLGESQRGVDALEAMTQLLARQHSSPFGVNILDMRTPAAQRLDRAWTHLVRQEGSEYWQRVWVLQEVACAKSSSVVYGPVAVDFEELLQCEELESLYQFWATGTQDGPFFIAAEWVGKLYALRQLIKTGGRINLVDLIEDLSGASSTRLADRVYGLLGLWARLDPNFDPERLEIDYDKDLESIAWDVVLLTLDVTSPSLWTTFHYTVRRVFRALGLCDRRISPPRNHHNFSKTSQSRRLRTRRICQIYDAVVASGYPWAGGLGVWSADWSVDSVARATTALEKVLSHVCTSVVCPRQKMTSEKGMDAILGLSLVICNMEAFDGHEDATDLDDEDLPKPQCAKMSTETLPRLCEAHLPQHLRRNVQVRGRSRHHGSSPSSTARVHQLQPLTAACRDGAHWWDKMSRCDGGSPEDPCDDAKVYLEIPELALVLCSQRDTHRDASSEGRAREQVQWFCTACPLLGGAVEEQQRENLQLHMDDSDWPLRSPAYQNQATAAPTSPTQSDTTPTPSPTMSTISEWDPPTALPVTIEISPAMENKDRGLDLRSADFPWGRRPSLMDAWKQHKAMDMSRASNDRIAE